jgi:chromosome segregation ATPase
MEAFVVGFLFLNGVIGLQMLQQVTSDDKPESLTTSIKITSVLRDILNQESLVRFSMLQKIQGLTMDVLDNKNQSQTMGRKLSDVISESQTNAENYLKMEEENSKFREELKTLNETNLKLEGDNVRLNDKVNKLNLKMEENSKFQETVSKTNKRLKEDNVKLNEQVAVLNEKMEENSNFQKTVNKTNKRLKEDNVKLNEQVAVLNRTLENTNMLIQMVDIKLQNFSDTINKTVETLSTELKNASKDPSKGTAQIYQ